MTREKKKKIDIGNEFLNKVLNATPEELDKMTDRMADTLTMQEGGREGLEKLAKEVLDGKMPFGVLNGVALAKALKKVGSKIDIYQMTMEIVECPECGKKTLVRVKSPPWTWECLAGRRSEECKNCGYCAWIMS